MYSINSKKVSQFLKGLNEAELIYLQHMIDISRSVKELVKKYGISKEMVCEEFKIKPSRYNDFMNGGYEYRMQDMATINAVWCKYEIASLDRKAPIQVKLEDRN